MKNFVYDQPAARVIFGVGSLDCLAEEVKRLGARRAIVLATPEQRADAEDAARRLGDVSAGVYAEAVMHVPIETARAAREEAKKRGADCYVAIGGGSTVGLGKAIALESGLPIVAVPTTFAGSEMTPIWGVTAGGMKKTGRDSRVLPRTVIYDPILTLTLPAAIAGASGMNAIAHCVEALYSENANPIVSMLAEEGIRALADSLPKVVGEPESLEHRSRALYGAWLAGISLGSVGMALHHKLCHALGGGFNLPHAETHNVILPHATAYNRAAAPEAMARIARALGGVANPAGGLFDLARRLGTPRSLREIGMKESDLERAVALATTNPYYNPRPVTRQGVRALLDDAFHGRRPAASSVQAGRLLRKLKRGRER